MSTIEKKLRIGYCIWLESLAEDVIKGQVLDVLESVAHRDRNLEIVILAFTRLNDFLANREHWNTVKEDLCQRRIRLLVLPTVLFPTRFEIFFAKWYLLPIVACFALPALLLATGLLKLKILHLRSYPLVPSALLLTGVFAGTKIIFDTRSPFPEESVSTEKWEANSFTFRLWKYIEEVAINRFDSTVCVSNAHANKFRSLVEPHKVHVIHNNAAGTGFSDDERRAVNIRRLATCKQVFCFAYVGGIGRRGVSRPEIYSEVISRLRQLCFQHHFLFITRDAEFLRENFNRLGILPSEYTIKTCDPEEVANELAAVHAGLTFLNRPDVRMSVKTAEYLASGLPFLCNGNALGAQEIALELGVGISTEMENVEIHAKELIMHYDKFLKRTQEISNSFSTSGIASEYYSVYSMLRQLVQ